MSVRLIVGGHQSGKTRRAWELLRGCPLGSAVLITPQGVLSRDTVRAWHEAFGAGALPQVMSLDELFASVMPGPIVSSSPIVAAHLVRRYCAEGALAGTPLESIAGYRATARDLSDSCLRFDAHRIGEDELALAVRTLRSSDERLARKLSAINGITRRLGAAGVRSRGRRLGDVLDQLALSCRWQLVVCDDLISITPAEVQVLRDIARSCQVVLTAVADARLQHGSLLERVRSAFPDASEELLHGVHPLAPHTPQMRTLLAGMLTDGPLPASAISFYHYRDEPHAGRALAAYLRRHQLAPGDATLYVRTTGEEALALADALQGAGVPVRGSFSIALGATARGGLWRSLGQWCAMDTWEHLLAVCERLALGCTVAADDGEAPAAEPAGAQRHAAPGLALPPWHAPVPPRSLLGPWAAQSAAAALERLAALLVATPSDGYDWLEPHRDKPWLTATVAWLRDWLSLLQLRTGTWLERCRELCARLQVPLPAPILMDLSDLEGHHRVGPLELEELLGAQRVLITRGETLAWDDALQISDAVRGRSELRAVAILHGLEHGRWPASPRRGICLARDERNRVALALDGRDPWDEAGQASGETAALLAVLSRATTQVLCGIPCGERVPSPYLGAMASQLGLDLVAERGKAAAEAVPGAPLGIADSLGEHERSLWSEHSRRPDFHFRIPRREPSALGISASRLNDLLSDPFAFVLGTLGLDPPLSSVQRRRDGQDLHDLLSELARDPPEAWAGIIPGLLRRWVTQADDHLAAISRSRVLVQVGRALQAETALALGCRVSGEETLSIPIPDGAGGVLLTLRGKADRIDRDGNGQHRIVDYKFSRVQAYRTLIRQQHDGQLAAYACGVLASGRTVGGAYYRSLLDGDAAGYLGPVSPPKLGSNAPTIEVLPHRLLAITAAIQALADGHATTDPQDSLCAARGFAPIARLDEARLLPAEDAPENENEA